MARGVDRRLRWFRKEEKAILKNMNQDGQLHVEDFKKIESRDDMTPFDVLLLVAGVERKILKRKMRLQRDDQRPATEERPHDNSVDDQDKKAPEKKEEEEESPPFHPLDMPRDMREWIEGELGGTRIFPVCQKILFDSDVNKNMRLNMTKTQIAALELFLKEGEREVVSKPSTRDAPRGFDVRVVGRSRRFHTMSFRMWELKKNSGNPSIFYTLTKRAWLDFVQDNKLKKKDEVQVWWFRVNDEPHAAVIVVKEAPSSDQA